MGVPPKNKAATLPWPLCLKKICDQFRLPLDFHYLAGNTLPLTSALHPCVGEPKRAIKRLAVLGRSLFVCSADNDCEARPVAPHRELFIHGRLVRVFIFFDLRDDSGLAQNSPIPIDAVEVVGDE